MRQMLLLIFTVFLTLPMALSAEPLRVTLPDGREVVLNEDFTWYYAAAQTEAVPQTAVPAQPQAKYSASQPVATTLPVQPRIAQTTQKKIPSQLTAQHSGVMVKLNLAAWLEGEEKIAVALQNNALKPVVAVDVGLNLFDPNGNLIQQYEVGVWRSIKRMAGTYLRRGQSAEGIAIKPEVAADRVGHLELFITDIDFR